jgi:chromosome segregation ATPase
LAKHYIVVIKEHSEIQEANEKLKSELFELKNDNADLERELNIKQGQIKYLKRRERRQETPSDSLMPT